MKCHWIISLTPMLLMANFANTIWCKKNYKMTKTLANGYSSESTQRELSNEYQHDRVVKNLCILVLWMKVASALEGLIKTSQKIHTLENFRKVTQATQGPKSYQVPLDDWAKTSWSIHTMKTFKGVTHNTPWINPRTVHLFENLSYWPSTS